VLGTNGLEILIAGPGTDSFDQKAHYFRFGVIFNHKQVNIRIYRVVLIGERPLGLSCGRIHIVPGQGAQRPPALVKYLPQHHPDVENMVGLGLAKANLLLQAKGKLIQLSQIVAENGLLVPQLIGQSRRVLVSQPVHFGQHVFDDLAGNVISHNNLRG
jgi:hypothetical protein